MMFPVAASLRASSGRTRGLGSRRFEALGTRLVDGLAKICAKSYKAVFKLFAENMKDIKLCSQMQLDTLKKMIHPFGIGKNLGDMVDKAYLVSSGKMAEHLAYNTGIAAKTFVLLPRDAQVILNTGEIAVRRRGRVVTIQTSKLTSDELRGAVWPSEPGRGIIPLKDRKKKRTGKKPPVFYKPVRWYKDDGDKHNPIIVVGEQNGRTAKFRTNRETLLRIIDELG